ncbi:Hypothetical predicted protein [Octopus vulgaris]|uniref:Uncharacterized protein n=1 Tax=Octopus vulgaris TaxID=6645 RepID=A0AA36AGS1_OCTVU|nr:Hypothetical predicted protein [Octopus vulgaris]
MSRCKSSKIRQPTNAGKKSKRMRGNESTEDAARKNTLSALRMASARKRASEEQRCDRSARIAAQRATFSTPKNKSFLYCSTTRRPSQERHTANSYSKWRTRNQDSRPYLDENKLANVRRDIPRNNKLTGSEISAIKHATENDINIRHKGNEESDEQNSPPRGLIERLPSDQSTQRPEDTRNSIEPVKDSQENDKTTVTEDLAFAEEHRESMAGMRQKS